MKDLEYDWTIMVYLSGDNNLSSEMLWALTEIERAADALDGQRRIALTVQYDPLSPACGTLLYSLPAPPKEEPVEDRPAFTVPFGDALRKVIKGEDAASSKVLGEFIQWSTEMFPSKYRMLILSGHGSGAEGDFLTDNNPGPGGNAAGLQTRAPSKAPELPPPGTLTIPALGRVLRPQPPKDEGTGFANEIPPQPLIHVLGMDSCLMSTLEVAHQVSAGGVKFLVGSEGFIPNTGWPYFELLTRFTEQRGDGLEPEAMSAAIVDECADYYAAYLPAGVSLDIASCELAHIPDVATGVRQLAGLLTQQIAERDVQNAVILAHWRAQAFKLEQYTDLWDFCNELLKVVGPRDSYDIAGACLTLLDAINRVIGIPPSKTPQSPGGRGRQRSLGLDFQYARGLSVYFPWCAPTGAGVDYFNEYCRLSFPSDSEWGLFLTAYLRETMRAPRNESDKSLDDLPLLDVRGRGLMAQTKNVSEYNKNVSEYNKFISQMFGGRPPWCTRNPPQRVDVSPQPPASKAPEHAPVVSSV
jgi:hypothetical protein